MLEPTCHHQHPLINTHTKEGAKAVADGQNLCDMTHSAS